MMFPKYALLKNQILEEFSHFFVAIFSLIFIGHLYQHLLLNSFILNHTSRLSSCKILLFLGCMFKFPTWQDFPIFLFFFFFFFFFFSLALTFAQTALLGFQPSGLLFFFLFFFLALTFAQTALLGFQPSRLSFFFSFFFFVFFHLLIE